MRCSILALLLFVSLRAPAGDVRFVRQGLVAEDARQLEIWRADEPVTSTLIELNGSSILALCEWQPGSMYRVRITPARADEEAVVQEVQAPLFPAPYRVWTFPLEDVGAIAATGATPDCDISFSPDGRRLAVATFGGYLRVLGVLDGKTEFERHFPEGMIKRVAWSADGKTLWAGEQSSDANLYRFVLNESVAGAAQWQDGESLRLAERLETNQLATGNRYAIYSWPNVAEIRPVADGRTFVLGTHSWNGDHGFQQRSAVWCLANDGTIEWQFPADEALPLGATSLTVDEQGTRVLFYAGPASQQTAGEYAGETLYWLDGTHGEVRGTRTVEPKGPYFSRAESWDSLDVSRDGEFAVLGMVDGSAHLFELGEDGIRDVKELELATPRLVGRTPVAAAASYCRMAGEWICLETQNTHIPFGSSQAAHHPPSPHHGANTLTIANRAGEVAWRFRGPYGLTGVWTDRPEQGDPRWLLTLSRELPGAREPGQFGALLFDMARTGGGQQRLEFHYPTVGPVGFDADISRDGRWFAVVEVPAPAANGRDLYGTHQVHLVH
jgi:hypothetical protein